jgi:hypothetical protein
MAPPGGFRTFAGTRSGDKVAPGAVIELVGSTPKRSLVYLARINSGGQWSPLTPPKTDRMHPAEAA